MYVCVCFVERGGGINSILGLSPAEWEDGLNYPCLSEFLSSNYYQTHKFFFFSSVIEVRSHYSRGKNQMFVNQRPPILDSINKYLLKHLRCLLFHEFSRFLFLIFSFSAGYERRSSSAQINRESKKGKIWQNMGKTCCKIVENNCFKCFIGLVTLLSTGALVSESM